MGSFGWIIIILLISYASYPKRVKRLEGKLKKLEIKNTIMRIDAIESIDLIEDDFSKK